jgi:serpin B
MAYNGAEGETKTGFEETMRLSGLSRHEINEIHGGLINHLENADPDVKLEIANSIWLHNFYTLERTFADTNIFYYDAEVNTLDFFGGNAENIMNKWVSDNTHEKITKIIDVIPPLAVAYIMNAVYFNGNWTKEFDKENSKDMRFNFADGTIADVAGMQMQDTLAYFENEDFSVVDLPYGNEKFSMTIFLPSQESNLSTLIEELSYVNWVDWVFNLKPVPKVYLEMPKFKYSFKKTLNEPLIEMGLSAAFRDDAEFPGIIEEEIPLFISEVLHKTYIDVNEEGTEAAAVTSIGFETTSVGEPTPVMIINRPFMYVIREKTSNALVFMGTVGAPEYD